MALAACRAAANWAKAPGANGSPRTRESKAHLEMHFVYRRRPPIQCWGGAQGYCQSHTSPTYAPGISLGEGAAELTALVFCRSQPNA